LTVENPVSIHSYLAPNSQHAICITLKATQIFPVSIHSYLAPNSQHAICVTLKATQIFPVSECIERLNLTSMTPVLKS